VALILGALQRDVDLAHVVLVGVVEGQRRVGAGDRRGVPEVGEIHHGELEALAAVDGEDLHRVGV
jgi:hypothetical protein